TKLAVAIVSIPHFIGTLIRFVRLRRKVNRSLALTFGVASALGGLAGAALNAYANSPLLSAALGLLLVFAGLSGVTGIAEHQSILARWPLALISTVAVVLGTFIGYVLLHRIAEHAFR